MSKPVEEKPAAVAPATSPFGKKEDKEPQKPSGLFGKKETEEKPKTGLFGNSPANPFGNGGGMFGKKPTESKPEEKDPEPTKEKEDTKPEAATGGTLFSAPGSLFGAKTQGGLFNKSTSLFGKSAGGIGGKSLFSGVTSGEGFIKSGQGNDEEKAEPDKPTFVEVSKDPHIKLFHKNIEKFQLRTGSKGTGHISIERANDDQDKKFAFLIFRNGVGKTLFSGQILADHKAQEVSNKPSKC